MSGHRYDLRPTPVSHPLLLARNPEQPGAEHLPRIVDLRMRLLPPRDQGQEGCCSGFALCAGLEYLLQPGAHLAPAFSYYLARLREGTFPSDSGATIGDEVLGAETAGFVPEALLPYSQNPAEAPGSDVLGAGLAAVAQLPAQAQPVGIDSASLKTVLASARVIVFGARLYSSFETGVKSDGIVPMPDPLKEQLLGGHAMLLCGYDDDSGYWVVRNSWGANWGDTKNGQGGYCYLPYGFEQHFMEAWSFPNPPAAALAAA